MTLREAILAKNPLAVAALADRIRFHRGTHDDVVTHVQGIFERNGRAVPDLATIDGWLRQVDEGEETSHD